MILVPPTALRTEVQDFPPPFLLDDQAFATNFWTMWYDGHSLRPTIRLDLVVADYLLVQCAVFLNMPLIECRTETPKFDYKQFTKRFKEIAKRARTADFSIPKYKGT